jgi:hypothetical protein
MSASDLHSSSRFEIFICKTGSPVTISLYAVRGALDALEALDALATLAALLRASDREPDGWE